MHIAVNVILGYLTIGATIWALGNARAKVRHHLLVRFECTGLTPALHEAIALNAWEIVTWPRQVALASRRCVR